MTSAGALLHRVGDWWLRLFGWANRTQPCPEMPARTIRVSPSAGGQVDGSAPAPDRRSVVEVGPVVLLSTREKTAVAPATSTEVCPALRARTLEKLERLQQIPALQSFARDLLGLLGRTDVDVSEIIEVIARDSALCVRVLRMANSVEVSPANRVEDLPTAVHLLGVNRVQKAAQALFTLRDGNRVAEGFDWRHLWLHAIGTAEIADALDRRLRGEPPPALHVASLLHDVGKIVLSIAAPEEYRALLAEAWREAGRLEDLERVRLGVDHREAGRLFAERAGMPGIAIQAIAHHDDPGCAEEFSFEVALVAVANHVSKAYGLGFGGSRLGPEDAEFAELPAWGVIAAALGRPVQPAELEAEVAALAARVRMELRELHP